MHLKSLIAAAALSVAGSQAFAVITDESFDTLTSTYQFGASQITAADTSFSFTLNLDDGLLPGVYDILGDVSGTKFEFATATLNGQDWTLYADSTGRLRFGDIAVTEATDLVLEFTGFQYGKGAGNFQGSLVLSAVPEPESYALMLAGLAAVGFVARRRLG
jgi:hypothetical protein